MKSIGQKFLVVIFTFLAWTIGLAQTGPGGVGNSQGQASQPRLLMWFCADSIPAADGDLVGYWADLSGNGLDLSQGDDGSKPTYNTNQINGHSVLSFSSDGDASTDYLGRGPMNDFFTDSVTIFILYKTNDAGEGILSYNLSDADNEFLLFNSDNLRTYINGSYNVSGIDYSTDNPTLLNVIWTSTGAEEYYFKDGQPSSSNPVSASGTAISTGGYLAIGGEQDAYNDNYDPNQAFDGQIAEVVIYSNALNPAQRIILENYFSEKYGISIPNDYLTSNDPAYVHDVAGVGKYDNTLHLLASSAGFYVEAYQATLDNGEFAMFAHNNAPNSSSTINTTTDLPSGVEAAWNRVWYVEKTGAMDVKIMFDFSEGLTDGQYPGQLSNYVLLYRSGTSGTFTIVKTGADGLATSDRLYFELPDADFSSGYYTLGTLDETNSPVEGAPGRTWYTLISGDWDDWQIWTLDPSGALPNNPDHYTPTTSPTAAADKVVILSGKSVTVSSDNKRNAELLVYGTVDFGTTTGHHFDYIKGNGHIRLAADNFPDGDATDFITEDLGEGTVVYYGNGYSLTTNRTFYNVQVDLENVNSQIYLLADYTINGKLWIKKGQLTINDASNAQDLNITVKKDLVVEDSGKIAVGTANQRHQLNLYGNFINNGIVKFTNRTSADYLNEATDGIVDVNFLNTEADQQVRCLDTTIFYRIEIDKGSRSYILDIEATSPDYFKLYGYANTAHPATPQLTENIDALGLITGTVRIGDNIVIGSLSESGNYNISENASIWVDGGTVYNNSGNAIVVYGELKVTDGLVEAMEANGLTLRQRGRIVVRGGTVRTELIKTSTLGAENVGSYEQSGGLVIVSGASHPDYYAFTLTYPGNVFNMSGGTLHIIDASGNTSTTGGIFINSDPQNVNVTGGTVICEIRNRAYPFKITSRAPFWNLVLRNTRDDSTDHVLAAGEDVSTTDVDLAAQPLVVLNNLRIEPNALLKHNGQDIYVGGDIYIDRNSQQEGNNRGIYYAAGQVNTLVLNGSRNSTFYIGYNTDDDLGWELFVHNLVVNKEHATDTITILTDPEKDPDNLTTLYYNRILRVIDTIKVYRGVISQGRQSVRLFGEVYVYKNGQLGAYRHGITPVSAYFMLRDLDVVVHTEKGAILGNIKFNSTGTVTFTSDVLIRRVGMFRGLYNIGPYKLTVDYMHYRNTTNNFDIADGNLDFMIYTDGYASDGGLEIKIHEGTADGTEFGFPLGVSHGGLRYTPVKVTVSNVNSDGYIQVRPADDTLKTTNPSGGDILTFYWRVNFRGFDAGKPDVNYEFHYDQADVLSSSDETIWVPGKVLDMYPFTRSYIDDADLVDEDNNIIYYNNGTLDSACYTAGKGSRFIGEPDKYYTNAWYKNWDNASIWHKNDPAGPTGEIPQEGSIVYIYRNGDDQGRIWGNNIPYEPAMIIFQLDRDVYPDANSENIPRLQFRNNGTFKLGRVSGPGMISQNVDADITLIADWGDFSRDSCAIFMFWPNGNNTDTFHINRELPRILPSIMFEQGNFVVDTVMEINYDLLLNGRYVDVKPRADVTIGRDLLPGYWQGGRIHFPEDTSITITVKGNIDYTQGIDPDYERAIVVDDPGFDTTIESKLIVYGDIIQGDNSKYKLDLFNAVNRPGVVLELGGDTSGRYYRGTNSPAPDLYRIVMNKGDDQSLFFKFDDDFQLNYPSDRDTNPIELYNGTLILDDPDIDVTLTSGGADFFIPQTAALELRQGLLKIYGDDVGLLLDGKLKITGGTFNMATGIGNGNNYIEYSASGEATIDISGGQLLVGSQIRRSLASDAGILKYYQSGGTVEIGRYAAPVPNRGIFEVCNDGSVFNYTGGTFTIVNDYRSNPSIASLYFDPQTVNFASDVVIQFGNSNTVASADHFSLYAGKPIRNLLVDNSASTGTELDLSVVAATITGNLTIDNDATLNAKGLDITILGNWTNNGTFVPQGNTVYFSGSTPQTITGNTTFFNLVKDNINEVLLDPGTDLLVENDLTVSSGVLNTQGGSITVRGDVNNTEVIRSDGSSNGIIMQGSLKQYITGNGTFDRLMIDNSKGVEVPTGFTVTINDSLLLKRGVFDIGKNRLILTKNCVVVPVNPFSETNMIQTNISFTDAGVQKFFPLITSSDSPLDFTYPIGCNGKYTPVRMHITAFEPDNTSIRVKSSDERHPSIIEDSEDPDPEIVDSLNVLQYYWTMDAEGVTKFSADVIMQAKPEDVWVTDPYDTSDYITARLLDRSEGIWDKYIPEDFNGLTSELYFHFYETDDAGIDGDYTAGVDGATFNGAIPDRVQIYVSNQDGLWTNPDIWTPTAPAGGPKGAIVKIRHHVTVPVNYTISYKTYIEATGILDLGTTFGHRLGVVSGRGKLYLERGDLPAGYYDDFFAPDSGTVEFGGNDDYNILSEVAAVNNLILSGSGERNLPNLDLQIYGDWTISGAQAIDYYDRPVYIWGDLVFNGGGFEAGAGKVIFNGSEPQHISGTGQLTGTNALYDLVVDNVYGLYLQIPVDVDHHLVFNAGKIFTTPTNILRLTNTNNDIVYYASYSKFVDGPLAKRIIGGTGFQFPIGNIDRYGALTLDVPSGVATDYWIAQYYNRNPELDGMSPDSFDPPLEYVSHNEYWRVKAADSYESYITLRWDANSGVPSDPDDRNNYVKIAKWTSADKWVQVNSTIIDNTSASQGAIKSDDPEAFNDFADGNFYTLASSHTETFYWEGDESSDWHTAGNWSTNSLPTSLDDVIIPASATNMPVIENGDAEVKNMQIESGATLTVMPGHYLKVVGDLQVDGDLILEAPSGDGSYPSLLTYGDVTINGNFIEKLYLTAKEYHYVSSPLASGNDNSDLFCNRPGGGFNTNFYYYDETADLDGDPSTCPEGDYNSDHLVVGWHYAHNGQGNPPVDMETNKGYAFYDDIDRLIQFQGVPNTGILNVSGLSYTNNDPIPEEPEEPNFYDGWHLLGNPYPSYIDWDAIAQDLTNVDNAIYVWDGDQYASYVNGISGGTGNLTQYIAPMQGFFVHTTASNAGFSLSNSHRVHANAVFLKKNRQKELQRPNLLKLAMKVGEKTDYFALYFDPQATMDFDQRLDAIRLFANDYYAATPHLFSHHGHRPYSIDALPLDSMANLTIPLGYKIGLTDTFDIFVDIMNFDDSVRIILVDKQLDSTITLAPGVHYRFLGSSGIIYDRFELKFIKPTPPYFVRALNDTAVYEDKVSFIPIADAVVDPNNEPLNITISDQKSDKDNWFKYDEETGGIWLKPTNDHVGDHLITVTATDPEGLSANANFRLTVINVNDPPQIAYYIGQAIEYVNQYFELPVADAFNDIDPGDTLRFFARQANGSPLPAWLNFDQIQGILFGVPPQPDTVRILITAVDLAGDSVSQTIDLIATVATVLEQNGYRVMLYPNPVHNTLNISTSLELPYNLRIYSADGTLLVNKKIDVDQKAINVKYLPAGSYIVEISSGSVVFRHKLLKY